MKLLFLTQLFDPEYSIKGLNLLKALQKKGHQVDVVTTFPSYPQGKLYSGYKQRIKQVENIDGVEVTRILTYIYHGPSFILRMLSYCSFGVGICFYLLLNRKKYDLLYAYYPPVVIGLLAVFYKKITKTKFIYDVQDLWPEALVATGAISKGSRLYRLIMRLTKVIYDNASAVIVLSKGYKEMIAARTGSSDKIYHVYNWCDESRISIPSSHESMLSSDEFNVLYTGNFGLAQSLTYVVDAARFLEGKKDAQGRLVRITLIGAGVEFDMLVDKAQHLSNVTVLPRVPAEEIGLYLDSADVLLAHLVDNEIFRVTIPSKIQSYLLARKPVLSAFEGEITDLLVGERVGMSATSSDPESIASAIMQLGQLPSSELAAMGERGFVLYMEGMQFAVGVNRLHDILTSLSGRSDESYQV
ncbi:glycosyltransferase family 4 protein [Halodesulfovibrio aestuarii]|uniref:glycosyltransferase family 4 protein n=1 Tax=Halodesulfovibrio aestuarii TaxID=126333 RepID=UPI000415CFB9